MRNLLLILSLTQIIAPLALAGTTLDAQLKELLKKRNERGCLSLLRVNIVKKLSENTYAATGLQSSGIFNVSKTFLLTPLKKTNGPESYSIMYVRLVNDKTVEMNNGFDEKVKHVVEDVACKEIFKNGDEIFEKIQSAKEASEKREQKNIERKKENELEEKEKNFKALYE